MQHAIDSLPFGTQDLDPVVHVVSTRHVRCYVRGCRHVLRTPTRVEQGDVCPDHGIRCHLSWYGSTYSYAEPHRNIIVARELFKTRLLGHPFKYETHRFGLEKSEDALTWNVFRSLQEAGCLRQVANRITGLNIPDEPYLFLWGICLTGDIFEPWDLLIAARERFESNLPVKRPLTEPDIALYLPGRYLILIEAKFTSSNPFYTDGVRTNSSSLTKAELLDIYHSPELHILDLDRAWKADRVYYQLWRNMVFAEWMGSHDSQYTPAFHANLTRAEPKTASCTAFRKILRAENAHRFIHISWEDIAYLGMRTTVNLRHVREYVTNKTAMLKPAFSYRHPVIA